MSDSREDEEEDGKEAGIIKEKGVEKDERKEEGGINEELAVAPLRLPSAPSSSTKSVPLSCLHEMPPMLVIQCVT